MIDTHCHIDDPQYQGDFDAFIREQQAGGVELILVPATGAESCHSVLATCARYPQYLLPALGLHPEEVKEDWSTQLDAIYSLLVTQRSTIVAIGEIGLDYYWDTTYKEQQLAAFRRQLEWAVSMDLPVMIHCRNAMDDCLRLLREFAPKGLRGVMHCFSGSRESAVEILKLGLYLGIGGVLTFKNCKLKEVVPDLPVDRLLLETDAPYMAPVPHRGERNESRWMIHQLDMLADIYQIPVKELEQRLNLNTKRLFCV